MDDKELKKLLEENLKVSRESLKILKALNRARLWGRFFFFVKWGLVIALLVIGFIKVQPYLEAFSSNVARLSELLSQFNAILPGQ
ncbi:MAG: hypothetical protein COU47_01955 [Candidatus Niyogibacteria bacterium CG10_big_fil_rev_8_21_14_0_10_46_36]|uniref:Uncharacterized protein n=1 Tax=Candidatus Niyogibacteria bacterium CG10_big_fil_rev_8_21_14_0_10_46_36 TaxID=1974726 RepID=A0A2H0TDK9_9BACT|nr:MAG: hypothetical protein COU47_01955 [Candidatus Niyogibacteria bacterium CG10_big_fil_rev_8_21_14_0_10_46_36]